MAKMGDILGAGYFSQPKEKTTEEILEYETSFSGRRFDIDGSKCEVCSREIEKGCFIFEGTDVHYVCDKECADLFKNKYDINKMNLYEIRRCSSYKECAEIGNLRFMCEQQRCLTQHSMFETLTFHNFCEPAIAGQIKASYSIYKHLKQVDEENRKLSEENSRLNKRSQFLTIISTIMAALTIVLTVASVIKSYTDKPIDYSIKLIDIEQNEEILLEELHQNIQYKNDIYNKLEEVNTKLERFNKKEGEKNEQ